MPFPNAPPAANVPFPAAPRPPLAPGRPPARPVGPTPDELYPDPPLWQQILNLPFATTGRRVFFGIACFVGFGIWGINRLISKNQPKNNPNGIALYPTGGGMPVPQPPPGYEPEASNRRGTPRERAETALSRIGQGLEAYARQYGGFPDTLTDELHELKNFGDYPPLLAAFEGGKLASYSHAVTADFTQDVAVLEARAAGNAGETIRHEVKFYLPRATPTPWRR